jgi:Cellulase (glycosyl hydrolase family 5)
MRIRSRAFLGALAAAIISCGVLALGGPLTVTKIGGLQGTTYVDHRTNDSYEASELVAIDFNSPVLSASFTAATTITPAVEFRVSWLNYGKQVTIRFRKTPGVTYHVHVAPGVRALDGSTSSAPIDLSVKTAEEPVPKPVRAAPNEPYRWGILVHPYPFSLGGPNAQRIVDELADAGVTFVRIDYCGDQSEVAGEGRYDWSIQDRIADLLASKGITELPIVAQYCAPKWATGGGGYPSIWENPSLYAAFAGAVAQHVAATHPNITRIELFNEPNIHGWWTNTGEPQYAATDGTPTAQYMKAAYAAVKQNAPKITVVGPALASGGHDIDPRTFLDTLYNNGCRRGACWDVLSVHNYRWENPTFPVPVAASNRFDIYKDLIEIAAKHGDPGTHVMLTEWGYSTIGTPDGFDPQTQALYVALGFNEMLADPLVDGIVYVNMYNPATDFWGQTALVSSDFVPKPAYYIYREFARYKTSATRAAWVGASKVREKTRAASPARARCPGASR